MNPDNLSVRRKLSVDDGITKLIINRANVAMVDYQPGNGTRYVLQIVTVSDADHSIAVGFAGSIGWVITHLNNENSKTYCLPSYSGTVFPDVIQDKMGENASNAYVIAEFLAHYCNLKFAGEV